MGVLALGRVPCVNVSDSLIFCGKLVIPAASLPCVCSRMAKGNKLDASFAVSMAE